MNRAKKYRFRALSVMAATALILTSCTSDEPTPEKPSQPEPAPEVPGGELGDTIAVKLGYSLNVTEENITARSAESRAVEGRDLIGVTKPNGKIKQIAETKTVSAIFVMSLSGRIKHIVGLRGVQFVNSRNREQFVHGCRLTKRNFLVFCIFLRFVNLKVGSAYAPQGSKPHFSSVLS